MIIYMLNSLSFVVTIIVAFEGNDGALLLVAWHLYVVHTVRFQLVQTCIVFNKCIGLHNPHEDSTNGTLGGQDSIAARLIAT